MDDDGTRVRVICGDFWGKTGPIDGVAAEPRYLDVSVPPGLKKRLAVETSRHAFAYVFAGSGTFRDASQPRSVQTDRVGAASTGVDAAASDDVGNRSLVLFDSGDEVVVQAGEQGIRFLLVSGKPLEEPVAWYGPIVMNTQGATATGDRRTARRHLHQGLIKAPSRESAPPRAGGLARGRRLGNRLIRMLDASRPGRRFTVRLPRRIDFPAAPARGLGGGTRRRLRLGAALGRAPGGR